MKKKLLLISAAVMACGVVIFLGAFAFGGFDFSSLSTAGAPEKVEKTVSADGITLFEYVSYTDGVTVGVSPDEDIHITYYDTEFDKYVLESKNGVLSLTSTDTRSKWYQYIGFNFTIKPGNTVLLPKEYAGSVSLTNTTGDIKVTSAEGLKSFSAIATTGSISAENVSCEEAEVRATTGGINIGTANVSGSLSVSVMTGEVRASKLECGSVSVSTTTGGVRVSSLKCGSLTVGTTTGSIDLTDIDANTSELSATTGFIRGRMKGASADYSITSHTSTGRNTLPASQSGGTKTLNAHTSTGNIDISFSE